jgi:hypothetical protein
MFLGARQVERSHRQRGIAVQSDAGETTVSPALLGKVCCCKA